MPIWLLKFGKFVKGVPAWLWGVLGGLFLLGGMYLRMKRSDKAATAALGKAAVAKMKATTAKQDARIELGLEQVQALERKGEEIREATEDEIAAIADMDDAALSTWLKQDAARRAKRKKSP